jgi:hypothetical protein
MRYVSFLLQTLVIPASMRTTVNVGTLTIRAKPPQDKEVSCNHMQYKSFDHHCYPLPCTCTCVCILLECTLHRIFFRCAIAVRPPTPSSTTLAISASTANSLLSSHSSHLVGQPQIIENFYCYMSTLKHSSACYQTRIHVLV